MIRCIECGDKEVNNIGDLCPDCHLQRGKVQQQKIDEMGKYGQVKMWCPTCQREKMGALHCGECDAELQVRQPTEDAMAYSERRELHKPITYFCPCGNSISLKGGLCKECFDSDFKKEIMAKEKNNPNHIKLVGLNSTILALLKRWEEYQDQVDGIMIKIRNTSDQVVIELQKAVKGSAIQGIQIDAETGNVGIGH